MPAIVPERPIGVHCGFVSNSSMDHTKPTAPNDSNDQRLIDLEIKSSFTEDALEQLNQVVVRHQQELEWLLREVRALRQQVPQSGGQAAFGRPSEELPPHY